MQVTQLKAEGLKKSYKVVVDAETINTEMDAHLRAAGERVKMPGFRPGFIPMKVLKARYGKTVQSDVIREMIRKTSTELMADRKIFPSVTPNVNIEKYEEGGSLTYTIDIEAFPDVPEISFDKISLERSTYEIEESDIDETMATVAKENPELVRAKSGSKTQMGHVVFIDFKGMIDDVAFPGGTATGFKLKLGSKQFIDTFEEQLVGFKEGQDTVVSVTFPENYHSNALAGRKAKFEVTIKEIHDEKIPEIDKDFAKKCGFADLKGFREAIRKQMAQEYDQVVRNQLKKQLFDALEKECTFQLPENMVEMEFKTIWDRLKQAQSEGDDSLGEQSEEEMEEEYRQIARRRVKLGILLAEIGNRNKISVNSDELSRALNKQIALFPGQEKKIMEFYRNNPDRVQDLRGPIMEEKAVDFILAKVKFKDKKMSLKELADAGDDFDADAKEGKKKSASKSSAKKSEPKKDAAKGGAKKKSAS